ncbi:MAG TPA: polysaccharide biosynthesis tyrosine autokinase [Acidimicrobiales bacterium]|nr:polysaccharide biosynthesis tyrosine autokinase [Acidimicrobiales bacterium]
MDEQAADQPLTAYLQVVNRRKWWVVAVMVLAVGAAVIYSATQVKQYTATARVLAQGTGSPTTGTEPLTTSQLATDAQLATSPQVTSLVRVRLGRPAPPVSVYLVGTTNLIAIAATSTRPSQAAAIANAYAGAFASYELQVATAQAKALVNEYTIDVALLTKQQAQAKHNPTEEVAFATNLAAVDEDLANAEAALANPTSGIIAGTPAAVPTSPSSSKPIDDVLLGLLLGVIVGLGLAFLVDTRDDRLTSAADVQRVVGDLPVLAAVPKLGSWKKPAEPVLASLTKPTTPEVEAYWSLRASLKFLAREQKIRSVVVTSPAEGDGKTATVANLGVVLAESGDRTVLVSCDLRRPRLGTFFRGSREAGLMSVLLGEATLKEAVRAVGGVPNLWILDTGPLPPDPHRALADADVHHILEELAANFDMVLVDSPPLLPVADALALGQVTDATVVVTAFGRTRKRQLRQALETLETAHIAVAGVILNEVTPKPSSGYAYYYGYGQDSKRQAAHKKARSSRGRLPSLTGEPHSNGSARREGGEQPGARKGAMTANTRADQEEIPGE